MVTKDDVITVLRKCYDPEIPINIYDLGLVYTIDIKEPDGVIGVGRTPPPPRGALRGGLPAFGREAKYRVTPWREGSEGRGRVGPSMDARDDVGDREEAIWLGHIGGRRAFSARHHEILIRARRFSPAASSGGPM